mmetsp:Transcript_170689/g.414739  ORF Transcript_170689/g.414739 Transcript_170689/m.414739 type:complete len:219 (+) Transcript_170689:179-835(+)
MRHWYHERGEGPGLRAAGPGPGAALLAGPRAHAGPAGHDGLPADVPHHHLQDLLHLQIGGAAAAQAPDLVLLVPGCLCRPGYSGGTECQQLHKDAHRGARRHIHSACRDHALCDPLLHELHGLAVGFPCDGLHALLPPPQIPGRQGTLRRAALQGARGARGPGLLRHGRQKRALVHHPGDRPRLWHALSAHDHPWVHHLCDLPHLLWVSLCLCGDKEV